MWTNNIRVVMQFLISKIQFSDKNNRNSKLLDTLVTDVIRKFDKACRIIETLEEHKKWLNIFTKLFALLKEVLKLKQTV